MYYTIPSCRSSMWKTQYTSTASIGITRLLMITRTSLTVKSARQKFWQFACLARSGVCKHNAKKARDQQWEREKELLVPNSLGRVIKHLLTIWSPLFCSEDEGETSKTAANLWRSEHPSKFTPKSHCAMLKIQKTNKQKSYFSDSTGLSYHGKC